MPIVYRVALLIIEWQTSGDYVRNYFTDITGPVRFCALMARCVRMGDLPISGRPGIVTIEFLLQPVRRRKSAKFKLQKMREI